jgi:ribosomal protein S12 methylthiotransferase accessory factor
MCCSVRLLLIFGARCDDALGLELRKAFGAATCFVEALSDSDTSPSAHLAIGVRAKEDEGRAFDKWAQRRRIPALTVELWAGEALIGPLALPGRAGCGHCASARLTAAAAAARFMAEDSQTPDTAGDPDSQPAGLSFVSEVLVSEIRAILRGRLEESRLLDHILIVDTHRQAVSLHRVIPLSRCTVCGGVAACTGAAQPAPQTAPQPSAAQPGAGLSAETSPETLLEALAGWVDPRTGIISRLVVELPRDTPVEVPIVLTAAPPYTLGPDGSLRRLPIGWGKGLTMSTAILSAVGEAIERYAPSLPDPACVLWERPDDLDGEYLDPRAFALYTDEQYERDGFPYARFDPTVRHPWVLGRWLGSDRPVRVPAVFVFLSLTVRLEHQICQGNSNGLAAATDLEEAALRATLELVERDALMAAWLTGCPGQQVRLDGALDPQLRQVLDGIEALGAGVEFYVLPSACGTVALGLALGNGRQYPGVTIGLGADLDPLSAIRQAILELAQTGPYLRRMMRSGTLTAPDKPHQVREMLDHAAFYFPVERATAFDRLRSSQAPIALGDLVQGAPNRSLENCASRLGAAGVRVALTDVTSPDVATGPFRVVRAVSPDLQNISYGYGFDRPPVERIRARGLASEIPAIHPIW